MVATGVRAGRPAPIRLTRRGRIVVLTFFILMASLASAVLWTTASRADDPAEGPAPTVVVQPDDSLWSIAERVAPGRPPFDVIHDIRTLNDIDTWYVYAGETLVVPRTR